MESLFSDEMIAEWEGMSILKRGKRKIAEIVIYQIEKNIKKHFQAADKGILLGGG